jgi:hypothetical protein
MKKMRLAVIVTVVLALLAFAQGASAAVTLGDGGFELGSSNPYWTASSTVGYPLITTGDTHTGTYKARLGYSWAGGSEVSKVSQDFKMPRKGTAELVFWLLVPAYDPAGSDKLVVYVDGDKLFKVLETEDWVHNASYQQITIDLDTYLDGDAHTLTIKGTDKSGDITTWYVDDVAIEFDAIVNGSMEEDADGDKVPDGWKIRSPSGETRRVCNTAQSGSCSVRLQGTGGAEQLIYVWKPGPTGKAGDVFSYTAYFAGDAIPGGHSITVYATQTSGVETQVHHIGILSGTFPWTFGSTGWTVPFDYKKLRVVVEYTAATGTMWWDNVRLTQTGGPVPAPAAGALFGQ